MQIIPNALQHTVAILAIAGLAASAAAQQGVRSKMPRRDAGENALRMLAESRANRDVGNTPPPQAGPSPIAPGYRHGGYRYSSPGITIGYGSNGGYAHIGGGSYDDHHHHGHDVVYINRVPYYCYNGGYYPYSNYDRDYYYGNNRRQVVQSPTVIVIDRTGVSTNEVDPAEPIKLDEAQRISPDKLGRQALYAGDASQAVELLTEHVLANEGDRQAERLLGVALVLDGQTELGIALISRAYTGDPELAFKPMTRDTIDSLSSWRRVQRDIQRYANVQRTASSWLAAIVITQDELPNRTHADRLEQARRAGLDVGVADAFQRYLEGGEPIKKPEPATEEPAETEAPASAGETQ